MDYLTYIKKIFKKYNQKPVLYYKINAEITGSVYAGVFLSQIIYWWSQVEGDEFWHRDEDFKNELGLSDWELRVAKNTLKNLGICEIEQKEINEKNRWYKINHYKFNFEAYIKKIAEKLSQNSQPPSENFTSPGVRISQPPYSEIHSPIENNKENNREYICRVCEKNLKNVKKIIYGNNPNERFCSTECYKTYKTRSKLVKTAKNENK